MADHSQKPAPVDPAALQHAHSFWSGFTKYSYLTIAAIIVILALMAFFLV